MPWWAPPGFYNTHTHLYESPLEKSFVADIGRRRFYHSGLLEYLPVRSMAIDGGRARLPRLFDGRAAAHRHHHCHGDRLRPRGRGAPGGRVGMCLYMGLGYGSGRWYNDDGKVVKYAWGEEAGPRWGEHRPLHR